jgi:hypothetical protein
MDFEFTAHLQFRCPTECRLSRNDGQWKCEVLLRWTVDKGGQTLSQVTIEKFGDTIFDKADVEERIRRAQRAILNPSTPSKEFLRSHNLDVSELTFSKNCVCLQISGPDVADLSFCDLPGMPSLIST